MPRSKPLLVYDGDCGFCRLWIARWKALTGDLVDYAPSQEVAGEFPDIPIERFRSAVQLVEPGGEAYSGAEAVFRTLAHVPGKGWMLWACQHVPGAASVSDAAYRLVAGQRPALYNVTRLLWGTDLVPAGYEVTRWLFLRLLAVIYLMAFVSLSVQIIGLVGSRGILPAGNFLQAVRQALGVERYWMFPTLAWISASDGALRFFVLGGAALALLGIFGALPRIVFALLWGVYLSLIVVGQDFLSFQWDILLVETGFLAILFTAGRRASPTVVWLLRILLFRLLFSSGAVKLASGDPAWRNLTALRYHYETQPLPNSAAWYLFQLPARLQTISATVMFAIELVAPFFLFAPRRVRLRATGVIAFFQVLILITGNYAFFNWLTLVLCVAALDDAVWRRFVPARIAEKLAARKPAPSPAGRAVVGAMAAVIVFAGLVQTARIFWPLEWLPRPAERVTARLGRLSIVSSYGLFAVMTTSRPEIVVEGSNDGEHWLEYEFKYKPGDLKRAPPWAAPHQPRLDWQMWFAALGDYRSNPWFVNFMVRVLEGTPEVGALLAKNPFPEKPPRFIRASRYDYHFTEFATRRATGTWWRRTFTGLYFPVASLRGQ